MRFFLIAIIIFPMFCFSQNESNKYTIGVFLCPEINTFLSNPSVGIVKVEEKVGGAFGFAFDRKLNDKWSLVSGLGLGIKRGDYIENGIIFNTDINPQIGVVSSSKIESNVSFFAVHAPFLVQYNFRSRFFLSSGIAINYFFANRSKRTIFYGNGDVQENNIKSEKNLNFSCQFGIGYTFKKINLSIEFLNKYYLNKYPLYNANLYSIGSQVTYTLKR